MLDKNARQKKNVGSNIKPTFCLATHCVETSNKKSGFDEASQKEGIMYLMGASIAVSVDISVATRSSIGQYLADSRLSIGCVSVYMSADIGVD